MTQTSKATAAKAQDKVMPTMTLSELCGEAADHVARARVALFDESGNADRALLHLDEAIFCLRRLLAHGGASGINGAGAKLRSA
jgi:nucleoside-diphosphate-sugar epimerase